MSATKQNPIYYSGPRLQKEKRRAADSKTWQAGQFCRITDSGVVPCKLKATQISGVFATTQATATSSSDVYIERITSPNTKFIIATSKTTAGGADCRAATSMIGKLLNLAVGASDCICTVSISTDTNGVLAVDDLMSNKQPMQYATSDCPGYVLVGVTAAALFNEGL